VNVRTKAGCAQIWKAFVAAVVRRLRPDLNVVGDQVNLQVCGDR
jgi:hypothetical protein